MLAGELALSGIDVAIVERRANQELESPRARGLHSRTIEVLDERGIADRFLVEGRAIQVQSFAGIALDISAERRAGCRGSPLTAFSSREDRLEDRLVALVRLCRTWPVNNEISHADLREPSGAV